MEFVCMNCRDIDGKTNGGSLFCHLCSDSMTDEAKTAALDDYIRRVDLLNEGLDKWRREAA